MNQHRFSTVVNKVCIVICCAVWGAGCYKAPATGPAAPTPPVIAQEPVPDVEPTVSADSATQPSVSQAEATEPRPEVAPEAPAAIPAERPEPIVAAVAATHQGNWVHWRGPEQTGVSRERNLPDAWDPETKENLRWMVDYGCRSTPLVLNGRVYIINTVGDHPKGGASSTEQERVMCFDAETGQVLWEYHFPLFHTDIPSNRVGWANLAGDLETGYIYAHGVQGLFFCFDADGKIIWSKSLTENFGRISGYGGRTHSPFIDEDRVVISFLSSSWGEQGRSGHRYYAFDKRTGDAVWISEPGGRPLDTTYSTPVVAVINGQRLLIAGNADGGVYAMKARTGEKVWGVAMSKRGINVSPVVRGDMVYCGHSEENLDTNVQGTVICIDATGQGDVTKTHVKWRRDGLAVGYASPVIKDDRLYVVDNSAKLYCLAADSGDTIWETKLGTTGKGSPVWADGKLYVTEVNGRIHILKPGDTQCEFLDSKRLRSKMRGVHLEVFTTPAIARGRVYLGTMEQLFAIGKKDWQPESAEIPSLPPEPPATADATPAILQVVPAEVLVKPGDTVRFQARLFDASGRYLRHAEAEWSTKGLQGKISDAGVLSLVAEAGQQGGAVSAKVGEVVGAARVRVVPPIPWTEDFDTIEEKKSPAGWIGAPPVKFAVETLDGSKVLKKLGDNALFARADAFIGPAEWRNYTVRADVRGTIKQDQLPDMGVTASRYTLELIGATQRLRVVAWRPMPRIDIGVDFPWKPDTWYTLMLRSEVLEDGKKSRVRGKCWARGEPEPDQWQIDFEDTTPNTEGSPGIYAFSTNITDTPGTAVYFDNVQVTPND